MKSGTQTQTLFETMVNLPPFPGEQYFSSYQPPDYIQSWASMKRHMQLVTVLFIFVLPVIVKAYYNPIKSYNESSQSAPQDTNKDTQTAKPNRNKKYKIKTKTEIRNKSNTVVESIEHIEQHEKLTKATKDIPWYILPLLNVLCVFILFGIIFLAPTTLQYQD